MSLHLHRDLENLNQELMSQAGRVEQMIYDSVNVLCERRYDLVARILAEDDVVDQKEVRLEEECLKLLALHQPVASDLRRITTILKLNSDLERIADLACNIAERAECLREFPYFPMPDELVSMASNATEMLRTALDAFVNSNTKMAIAVVKLEARVDEQNREIIKAIEALLCQDPNHVQPALHVFSATRQIEQVADHAANVAEEVIYMIDGEIVRHKHIQLVKSSHG
ncbi:MAG: phosphate signaling complex protein PhoU [Pirellulaceae bacterium]|nr:phosphate signaling complex protein PhoU [Pirellulaceae bacterium]